MAAGQNLLNTQANDRRDDARAASFLLAHQQLGVLALPSNPSNGQVIPIVINGTTITITAKTGSVVNPDDVLAPGTAAGFATNVINHLRRPDVTNSNYVASSGANQTLLSYVGWAWPGSSTNIVAFSLNKNINNIVGNLTSFNITGITVTSGTWTAATLKLYVEDGAYYINGTRYLFTGGSTPAVTAPASNPRIDVLTIDTAGTLAWTTGVESATPSAPAYPENKLAICELYNVVGETALYDNENQQGGQGYIYNDVRPMMSYGPSYSAFPEDILPDVASTRNLGSALFPWLNIYAANVYANGNPVAVATFGGTGADGALSISSGTTTINLGGAAVFVKNYTSISITGTGVLAFSNPNTNGTIIILKSQGNVTLTSSATPMINTSGMGAQASGNNGQGTESVVAAGGANGSAGGASPQGAGSAGAAVYYPLNIAGKHIRVVPGGAGGTGQAGGTGATASGGAGGGGLIIECNGAWNFTTANGISVAGVAGSSGTAGSTDQGGAGAGGGGAGGTCAILYRTSTANTGTINISGGAGGTGGDRGSNSLGTVSAGGGGGAGGSNLYAGGAGGNAGGTTSGNATSGGSGGGAAGGSGGSGGNANGGPSASKSPGGGGGGGATGGSYVTQNTEFS
jgi:hypothetical protein